MNNKERFYYSGSKTEFAVEQADNSPGRLKGYAMKYGLISSDRGGYRDTFVDGCFANLAEDIGFDIQLLDNHETYLAREGNGSLTIATDSTGLAFSAVLPDTTAGRDAAFYIRNKDYIGMSFGYVPEEFEWFEDADGPIRKHTKGIVFEVSVVIDPAFDGTELSLYSKGEPSEAVLADLERWKKKRKAAYYRRQIDLHEKSLLLFAK